MPQKIKCSIIYTIFNIKLPESSDNSYLCFLTNIVNFVSSNTISYDYN